MPEINFMVKGSAQDPYEVTFLKSDDSLRVFCTCPAGENRRHCKHRVAIMNGSSRNVVSGNSDDIATVQTWLTGTDVEAALRELNRAEGGGDAKALAAAKSKLARAMNG